MLAAVSQLANANNEIRESETECFSLEGNEFPDFSSGNLLDSIDFDDLFAGINDGDLLPDLEMDPAELLADFSVSAGEEESDINNNITSFEENSAPKHDDIDDDAAAAASASASEHGSGSGSSSQIQGEQEIVSKREKAHVKVNNTSSAQNNNKGRKSSKNPPGKRKVKKYRSHRKHLLAREAEAASWSQRRHMYGGGGKRDVNPWIAPTMGFPPVTPMPPPHMIRPLHVWGHPSVDHSLMHMWPKHLTPSPPPPPHAWTPPPPPAADPSFWMSHHHQHHVATPPGPSCFPQHLPLPARFPTPPVHGIPPPPAMYKVESGLGVPSVPPAGQTLPHPPSDVHPSKESVDAAIGDVLSKPWLPLPLGLKPPSTDSVMVELQRQGISKIPPTCA
ncbi:hypothetical protein BUALT_Bualt03G0191600 [Buddleja alternifolia]|uniref:Uncharacterized protein n=1 Tax=Buddleja alternifolia TaxID=168488 RepID=A0AAV6Y1M0_9LAMI|nr:hypothetical protein BUALT_Bualt03G0191600 [Buddleja alternifolia]